jgi:Domain of unknown function (DUF4157)
MTTRRQTVGPRPGNPERSRIPPVQAKLDAGRLAAAVSARAFTVGQDIFFGPGQYQPASSVGRRLLAHELVHTLQQRDAPETGVSLRRFEVPPPAGSRNRALVRRRQGSRCPMTRARPNHPKVSRHRSGSIADGI